MKVNERETEYGILYGTAIEEQKYQISIDNRFESKFSDITDNDEVNDAICRYCCKAYQDNVGTKLENMYLVNGLNGKQIAAIDKPEDKTEDGVYYNEEFVNVLETAKTNGVPIIAIHNHPSGYPPSPDDFRKAYDNHYEQAFVVGHNGQIYQYANRLRLLTERQCADMQLLIRLNYMRGYDVDRAFREVYELLGLGYGIL